MTILLVYDLFTCLFSVAYVPDAHIYSLCIELSKILIYRNMLYISPALIDLYLNFLGNFAENLSK